MQKFAIAVHGGAGTIFGSLDTAALEADYKMALQDAILSAESILRKDGSALEAVEHAVRTLEDNPLFNAGVGKVSCNNNCAGQTDTSLHRVFGKFRADRIHRLIEIDIDDVLIEMFIGGLR